MLSVAITCTMGMPLCSSRYQRAASFLQPALASGQEYICNKVVDSKVG